MHWFLLLKIQIHLQSVPLQDYCTTATYIIIATQRMLKELQKPSEPLMQSLSRMWFVNAFTYLTDKSLLRVCLPNRYFAQESVICIHHWNKGMAKAQHVNKHSGTWLFPGIPVVTHMRCNCSNSVTRWPHFCISALALTWLLPSTWHHLITGWNNSNRVYLNSIWS